MSRIVQIQLRNASKRVDLALGAAQAACAALGPLQALGLLGASGFALSPAETRFHLAAHALFVCGDGIGLGMTDLVARLRRSSEFLSLSSTPSSFASVLFLGHFLDLPSALFLGA